jgi:hypothetical protein
LAHLLIGSPRDGAGVDHNQAGVAVVVGFVKRTGAQTRPDFSAVGLIAAAAEGVQKEAIWELHKDVDV